MAQFTLHASSLRVKIDCVDVKRLVTPRNRSRKGRVANRRCCYITAKIGLVPKLWKTKNNMRINLPPQLYVLTPAVANPQAYTQQPGVNPMTNSPPTPPVAHPMQFTRQPGVNPM